MVDDQYAVPAQPIQQHVGIVALGDVRIGAGFEDFGRRRVDIERWALGVARLLFTFALRIVGVARVQVGAEVHDLVAEAVEHREVVVVNDAVPSGERDAGHPMTTSASHTPIRNATMNTTSDSIPSIAPRSSRDLAALSAERRGTVRCPRLRRAW